LGGPDGREASRRAAGRTVPRRRGNERHAAGAATHAWGPLESQQRCDRDQNALQPQLT
jgi:hypothetical protein